MRRISKQTVFSWISLTFFCFQLLMILSLLFFLIVKTSGKRATADLKDPVEGSLTSVQKSLQIIDQKRMPMEQMESSVKCSLMIVHENLKAEQESIEALRQRIHSDKMYFQKRFQTLRLRQKLKSKRQGKLSLEDRLRAMESDRTSVQENIKAIKESIQIINQKVRSDEQGDTSVQEIDLFVLKILPIATLFVFALLFFNSAVNSRLVRSVQYRILIGHLMAFTIVLALLFLANGLRWLLLTTFPSAFEFFLTLAILSTVRYFSKSFILTRIFPLDLFLTGVTLWIVSFLVVVGFEAFLQNGFENFPLKFVIIVGLFIGFGLNILFLRKEI